MKTKEWTPQEGRRASVLIEDSKSYEDVLVTGLLRGNKVKIRYDNLSVEEEVVSTHELEPPMASDVNARFEYFRELVTLVLDGKVRSLVVTGEGGIGKTHTVNEVVQLEGLRDYDDITQEDLDDLKAKDLPISAGYDFVRIKGYTTPRALFDALRDNKDKRVIMDDCDSALNDVNALNIIKSAVDTYDRRIVQWRTAREQASFEFTGSLIFLSNKHQANVSQAVISRSIVVDLNMTQEEKIDRMGYLLPGLDCVTLENEERVKVLQLIDKYKYTLRDLNLRTLIKALIVYENTKSLEITRYQILNG